MSEGSGIKQLLHSSIKLLVKMKNVFVFFFNEKIEGPFWPIQYL